jgi:RNA polymerase sigma factor (sigma-70 family)
MTKVLCSKFSTAVEKVSFSLSLEEELRLIPLAQSGNVNARNELLNSQLKQIISLARSYANNKNSVTELIADGVLGFDHALKKFDISKKVRFVTYYRAWVRDYINRSVHNNHTIRPPMNIAKTNSKTDEELDKMKSNKRHKNDKVHTGLSMDTPINSNTDSKRTYGDTFTDDTNAEDDIINSLTLAKVLKSIDRNSREWQYIKYHYVEDMKLDEIGQIFNVSKQAVSANMKKTLSRLHSRLK